MSAAGSAGGLKRWRTVRARSGPVRAPRAGVAPQVALASPAPAQVHSTAPTVSLFPACAAQDALRFSRLRRRVAFWASAVPVAVATAAFFAT